MIKNWYETECDWKGSGKYILPPTATTTKTHDTVSTGKNPWSAQKQCPEIPQGNSKNIYQVATSIDINQPFRSESFHVPNKKTFKKRQRPEIPRNPGNCGDFVRCQPGICFDGWKSTFLSWWSLFRGELLHFRAVHSRWKFNTNMRQVSQMMSCTPGWCSVKASQAAKLELISSPQEQKGQWTHAPEKRHMKGHSIVPNQAMHYQGQPQTFTTHVWSFEA